MNEAFEKILDRLEEKKSIIPVNRLLDDIIKDKPKELGQLIAYDNSIKIVQEVAEEYNGGWIPCSERLPSKEEFIKSYIGKMYGAEFIVMIEGANKPTTLYYTLDGMWKDDYGEFHKVIAWQLLPESYKGSSQLHKGGD